MGYELGGEIVEVKGGFQYTGPRFGLRRNIRIKTSRRGFAGFYHSHPTSSNFSQQDIAIADRTAQPAYVLTPEGDVKKYDPESDKEEPEDRVQVIREGGGGS